MGRLPFPFSEVESVANKEGRLSLSVFDAIGGGGTFLVHVLVPEAQTLTQAESALGTLASLFTSVSGLGIKEATFAFNSVLEATPVSGDPNAGSGAVFDFNNLSNPSTFGLWVPGFSQDNVLPNGTIDITTSPMSDFVAAMVGAVMGGVYTNAQYIGNHAGLDAFYTNRKRKKRLRP